MAKKEKKLNLFCGPLDGGKDYGYVAAYSKSEAVQIIVDSGYMMTLKLLKMHWFEGTWNHVSTSQMRPNDAPGMWVTDWQEQNFRQVYPKPAKDDEWWAVFDSNDRLVPGSVRLSQEGAAGVAVLRSGVNWPSLSNFRKWKLSRVKVTKLES